MPVRKSFRIFDIVGPKMIGPSSSHTAGAAKLGLVANHAVGGKVSRAHITLYESFATTGRGHGTDKAIAGGLLGFAPDDERLRESIHLAAEQGVDLTFTFSDKESPHPNTARIEVEGENGQRLEIVGASIGGGNIDVLEIDGMEVSFSCAYPTLLIFHQDIPGAIKRVSAVLAERSINIAFMRVFRASKNQNACMVIETDSAIPGDLIPEIKNKAPEVQRACVL